jgi:hypothetical protein
LLDIGNAFGIPILGAIHNKRVILQARYKYINRDVQMSENEIKLIVKKYKRKASFTLVLLWLFAVLVHWLLVGQSIESHATLGIPYSSSNTGFILVVLIVGLSAVFHSCINIIEKLLIEMSNKAVETAE